VAYFLLRCRLAGTRPPVLPIDTTALHAMRGHR
jgi:hypothetical protein